MKRPIIITSTKGKTAQQIHEELKAAMDEHIAKNPADNPEPVEELPSNRTDVPTEVYFMPKWGKGQKAGPTLSETPPPAPPAV